MSALRRLINRWRFNRALRPLDRQIEAARRRHQPTRHLIERKSKIVHDSLRMAVGQ